MSKRTKLTSLLSASCAGLLAVSGFALSNGVAFAQDRAAPAKKGIDIKLEKGEVLQLIAPEARPEGNEARQTYYRTVFPIASQFGYAREGQLNVRQKVRSDYDPSAFLFFSWPSADAIATFRDNPQFAEFKQLRRQAWSELKIYDVEIMQDLKLSFRPDKHYTVLLAWLDDETRSDYTRYLDGIEPAVVRAGGRFIHKIYNPTMQALQTSNEGPGQITFVEWETPDGFDKVQQSDEYLAHQRYFTSSVQKFEFYWLNTPA